ncbi:hypothetical protein [Aeoliella sp.]|uniref:hypothetical protein n=1 Tax=Aeoliella sp. TaxID=2795800 RepID=UPI003CCBD085
MSFDSGYTAMLGQGGADQITYIGDGDGILGSFDVYDVSIPLVTTLSEQVPFNSLSLRFAGNSDWLPSLTLSETPPDLSKVSYTDAKLSAEDGYLGLDILTLSRVPEPSGVLLCVGLFGGLLLLRRKVNG